MALLVASRSARPLNPKPNPNPNLNPDPNPNPNPNRNPDPNQEPRYLVLHSISATGVPDADAMGGSDPYVRFFMMSDNGRDVDRLAHPSPNPNPNPNPSPIP